MLTLTFYNHPIIFHFSEIKRSSFADGTHKDDVDDLPTTRISFSICTSSGPVRVNCIMQVPLFFVVKTVQMIKDVRADSPLDARQARVEIYHKDPQFANPSTHKLRPKGKINMATQVKRRHTWH